jgi:hypothetical protein
MQWLAGVAIFHKLSFSKLVAFEFTRKGGWPELFARIIPASPGRFRTKQSAPWLILMPSPVQLIFKCLFRKTCLIAGGRIARLGGIFSLFIAAKDFDEELFSRTTG